MVGLCHACEHTFVTSQGHDYQNFKRALRGRHLMLAWSLASDLPKLTMPDALELLLLASEVELARFDRAAPRWHSRLCAERPLSALESQLALAAILALRSPAALDAAETLASICQRHGLDREARGAGAVDRRPVRLGLRIR